MRLVPQAKADTGLGPARAAPALIRGGARHAHSLEPRHTNVRLEAWNPRKAAVDDDTHAFDGDRGLGNRGREHDLTQALRCGLERKVLRFFVHRAVKGSKDDRRIADALLQPLLDAPDLALPGQERQDRTGFRGQGPQHGVRHLILDARSIVAAEITGLHREGAANAFDDGGIAEELRHPRAVERRRHWQDAQVLPEAALAVERKREPQIGIERALVELVEQHRADAGKLGIIKDHAGKNTLGHDLDACLRPRFRDHPRPQADPLADSLRQGTRHALGSSPRCDAPRFQHQDFPALEPAFVHQREGHACRLAGAGRGDEDSGGARGQGVAQFVQNGVNRKRDGKLHGDCIEAPRPCRKHELRRTKCKLRAIPVTNGRRTAVQTILRE